VITWRAPWVDLDPPAVSAADIAQLARRLAKADFAAALVLTSFHQSPLPTALVLRLAGVRSIAAISTDYPGSLLDVRHRLDEDMPEPERGLSLARAAGFTLPEGDDGRLAVRGPLPDASALTGGGPYVVAHPGASAPARRWPSCHWAEAVAELIRRGRRVILTGTAAERGLTAAAAAGGRDMPSGIVSDLAGRTDLGQLAAILAGAQAVLVANTGVAHLAAAVGTPVACLFAPVVPAARWAPYRVPHVLLGDQQAACRDSRAVLCPVPGHPCLSSVTAAAACDAIDSLTVPAPSTPGAASQRDPACVC
jgi:ADP-heptose:LPS heptosyltransferase